MWRHPWVFVREDGKQLDRDALSWRTRVVFSDAGFPHLEDSCVASIMDHKGVQHRIIADMMGHKNVPTFQRIYRQGDSRSKPIPCQAVKSRPRSSARLECVSAPIAR